jgi:hypothetical protein
LARSRSNGLTFDIGTKLGALDQGQKDILKRMNSAEEVQKKILDRMDGFDRNCLQNCGQLKQAIDDIKNPKISLRQIGHAIVKGAGWAGGAAIAFASVYQVWRLIFHI